MNAGDSLQTPADFQRPGNLTTYLSETINLLDRMLEINVAPAFEKRGEFFKVLIMDGATLVALLRVQLLWGHESFGPLQSTGSAMER